MLFAARIVIDRAIGEPPSSASELVTWAVRHQVSLAWANELAVFAAVLLIPAALALFVRFDGSMRPWVGFGCGFLATTVPLALTLGVIQGRLMYPVYGIDVTDASTVPLVVSLYFGGAHLLSLMFAATFAILGIALRPDLGAPMATLSAVATAGQIAASYPWLIGPDLLMVCQLLAAGWFVVMGLALVRDHGNGGRPTATA